MALSFDNKGILILNCPFSYELCWPKTEIGAKLNIYSDKIMNFTILIARCHICYSTRESIVLLWFIMYRSNKLGMYVK